MTWASKKFFYEAIAFNQVFLQVRIEPSAQMSSGSFSLTNPSFVKLRQHARDVASSAVAPSARKGWSRFLASVRRRIRSTDWARSFRLVILLILAFPDFDFWPLACGGSGALARSDRARPRPLARVLPGLANGDRFLLRLVPLADLFDDALRRHSDRARLSAAAPGPLACGTIPRRSLPSSSRAQSGTWGIAAILRGRRFSGALEWARLAYHRTTLERARLFAGVPILLIQSARWGGVYAVGFLLVAVNAAIAFLLLKRTAKAAASQSRCNRSGVLVMIVSKALAGSTVIDSSDPEAVVVALQPNVPMDLVKSTAEMQALTESSCDDD